jgi:hypothetical protein
LVFDTGPQFLNLEPGNLAKLSSLAERVGGDTILKKVRGAASHGGGVQLTPDAQSYVLLEEFLKPYLQNQPSTTTPQTTQESIALTFRRASLILTGKIPAIFPPLESEKDLDKALSALFEDNNFYDFIKRGANDRLLTRSINSTYSLDFYLTHYYPMYSAILKQSAQPLEFQKSVSRELGEGPLELISHVVRNNRPYTEILTADYTMVSKNTAVIFEANLSPEQDQYLPSKDEGQMVSGTENPVPSADWEMSSKAFAEPVGILNSLGFLQQYQTNATNRNRARARWTYQHFLGIDIENSSSRNIDASVLIDVQGGIPSRLACKVCHDRIDPVAGAFQRYGARGMYLDGAFGIDTLDWAYKKTAFYSTGDTWYRSMLAPGFEGVNFGLADNIQNKDPLRMLAEAITAHPKFAEGTIKFWWPALFGEELLPYYLNDDQLAMRQHWLTTAAEEFRNSGYNLKSLMASLITSPFFRSTSAADNPYKSGRRLLTPEELRNKTKTLTNYDDGRLTKDWLILYGGIDSYNVETRQRSFSNMMLQAAKLHASDASCTLVDTRNKQVIANTNTESKLLLSTSSPASIQSGASIGHQLILKNNQSAAVNLKVKFIVQNDALTEYAIPALAAKGVWVAPLQNQAGTWTVYTDTTTPISLQAVLSQPSSEQTINALSTLAFNFWGVTSDDRIQELYEFYLNSREYVEPQLVEGCISIRTMPLEQVAELARWRLLYIRLMTDYHYLYE